MAVIRTECLLRARKLSTDEDLQMAFPSRDDLRCPGDHSRKQNVFERVKSARLLEHGEVAHRPSRKLFSIAIFSNARWRGEFREGVNRDGARLFQHSMSATAQMAPHCTTVRRTPINRLRPPNAPESRWRYDSAAREAERGPRTVCADCRWQRHSTFSKSSR